MEKRIKVFKYFTFNKIFNLGLLTTGIEPVPRTYKERNLTTNIREHNAASFIKKLSNLFILL